MWCILSCSILGKMAMSGLADHFSVFFNPFLWHLMGNCRIKGGFSNILWASNYISYTTTSTLSLYEMIVLMIPVFVIILNTVVFFFNSDIAVVEKKSNGVKSVQSDFMKFNSKACVLWSRGLDRVLQSRRFLLKNFLGWFEVGVIFNVSIWCL